ncbi:hypothetical protein BC939DRAFT_502785 [Gamsiella multidivaricata]|uniref:uncharacterized protein n=1 Tax=Gamsiella multidivaricata TaxID=101098 RepID=UPI00221F8963|nr:uncharacterized protein BC939DRAFT_502785 [Gamsiella multidivaricata]KAG0360966.1 hypothetical protein BGZ54_009292 [Gamsiella multidivaricata]KAI7824362.1 hypothetical protein BC939DRAFT_502785 [Gamsiella multidivaricata]
MRIPTLQDLDPDKKTEQELQNGVITAHWATLADTPSLPRGYLYPLELLRIHRLLRPLKAKIAAIHLAIKTAPSFGYISAINAINTAASPTTEASSDNESDSDRPARNIKHKYGQSRSLRARRNPNCQPQTHFDRRPTSTLSPWQPLDTSDGTTRISSIMQQNGSDILVKRFRLSLKDLFKDVVEKVWWHPLCENHDLPLSTDPESVAADVINMSVASLRNSCAFTVGRTIARLPENLADIMEKYYGIMPPYMRRFALLEHIVELCVAQVPVGRLIEPLVGVCAKYKANAQALRLLEHLSGGADRMYRLDLQWAYNVALRIRSSDAWIAALSRDGEVAIFLDKSFYTFIRQIQPQHRAILIQGGFERIMGHSLQSMNMRSKRSRASYWTSVLIEDSLRLHEQSTETSIDFQRIPTITCDSVIEYVARCLLKDINDPASDGADDTDNMVLKDTALALALHALYVSVTESSNITNDEKAQEWIQLLETRLSSHVRVEDFDVVINSYGILTNLNALALMLDAVGLYGLSMKLITRMLDYYVTLEKKTRRELGYKCDITESSLERYLREVKGRRIQRASNDSWRYDTMLGDWVQRTPKANKIASMVLSDGSEESADDGTSSVRQHDSQKIFSLSYDYESDDYTARRRRLISRSSYPKQSETLTEELSTGESSARHRQQIEEASPFEVQRRIQCSMTPVRRPVRASRRSINYSDLESESDSEEKGSQQLLTPERAPRLRDLFIEPREDVVDGNPELESISLRSNSPHSNNRPDEEYILISDSSASDSADDGGDDVTTDEFPEEAGSALDSQSEDDTPAGVIAQSDHDIQPRQLAPRKKHVISYEFDGQGETSEDDSTDSDDIQFRHLRSRSPSRRRLTPTFTHYTRQTRTSSRLRSRLDANRSTPSKRVLSDADPIATRTRKRIKTTDSGYWYRLRGSQAQSKETVITLGSSDESTDDHGNNEAIDGLTGEEGWLSEDSIRRSPIYNDTIALRTKRGIGSSGAELYHRTHSSHDCHEKTAIEMESSDESTYGHGNTESIEGSVKEEEWLSGEWSGEEGYNTDATIQLYGAKHHFILGEPLSPTGPDDLTCFI